MIGKFLNKKPRLASTTFVAPDAILLGAVEIGEYSSIWYGVIARADINVIKIGSYTNIQDGTIIHVDDDLPAHIGDYVTVGHGAIVHGSRIEDHALIGMGAIILNGATVSKGAVVAAGSVVCENFVVPEYALAMGAPARIKRMLTKEEKKKNAHWAEKYAALSQEYKKMGRVE